MKTFIYCYLRLWIRPVFRVGRVAIAPSWIFFFLGGGGKFLCISFFESSQQTWNNYDCIKYWNVFFPCIVLSIYRWNFSWSLSWDILSKLFVYERWTISRFNWLRQYAEGSMQPSFSVIVKHSTVHLYNNIMFCCSVVCLQNNNVIYCCIKIIKIGAYRHTYIFRFYKSLTCAISGHRDGHCS